MAFSICCTASLTDELELSDDVLLDEEVLDVLDEELVLSDVLLVLLVEEVL